jgi:hypothetical protein
VIDDRDEEIIREIFAVMGWQESQVLAAVIDGVIYPQGNLVK